MTTPELGKLELVPVYEAWPRGEWDFTPWLSENMDLLSKAVGFELELIQAEATLPGAMRVDVLARVAGTEDYVVIENQMGVSDNDHLAGLLNYASHSDSKVLIWVAGSFGKWALRTLDWLNDEGGIQIYALKMSAQRNGGNVEGRLELVAGPNQRGAEWPGYQYPPEKQKYLDFFRPLVAEWFEQGIAERNIARPVNDQEFPSGYSSIHYHVGFWGGSNSVLSIYLYVVTFDPACNKRIFDPLYQHRQEIEEALPEVWWGKGNGQNEAVVGISIPGSIEDSEERLHKIRAWASKNMPKFKAVIQPYLDQVISELLSDAQETTQ